MSYPVILARLLAAAKQEVKFEYSRSPGPGGQHVNKVSTTATLCFDLDRATSLSNSQKQRVWGKLRTRISKRGVLRVSSRKYRSQSANRKAALERFEGLLADALKPTKRRIPTRASRASQERRIQQKKKRGRAKQLRGRVNLDGSD